MATPLTDSQRIARLERLGELNVMLTLQKINVAGLHKLIGPMQPLGGEIAAILSQFRAEREAAFENRPLAKGEAR